MGRVVLPQSPGTQKARVGPWAVRSRAEGSDPRQVGPGSTWKIQKGADAAMSTLMFTRVSWEDARCLLQETGTWVSSCQHGQEDRATPAHHFPGTRDTICGNLGFSAPPGAGGFEETSGHLPRAHSGGLGPPFSPAGAGASQLAPSEIQTVPTGRCAERLRIPIGAS